MTLSPLSPQQRAALGVRGASVVLATGAGCGKTTVLTEKFVATLSAEPRVPIERLVALTFTDKAARELRDRVRRACRDRLEEGEEPDYWRDVLRKLEAAPIGTFHTFCGEVVRRHAVRAGVDPGFSVLDEAVASTCREEAVDAALRRALASRDADLRELAVALGLEVVRDHLIRLLGDRSAWSLDEWARSEPSALIERWREAFESKLRPAIFDAFGDGVRPCLGMIARRRAGFPSKMNDSLAAIVDLVDSMGSLANPLPALAEVREHAKMPRGLRAEKWPDPELYPTCKDTFEAFRDLVDRTVKGLTYDDGSTQLAAELGTRLARVGAKARREFAAVKRRRGALDFDDLLLHARDLLADDGHGVREELARRYDLILVDEFQDTDPIQDEIVRRIAGDDRADGRLFLVGDVKQSIYGFRGARPDLFAAYRAEFPEEGRLPLAENFRSRPGILGFVNALFVDAFPDYDPIVPGRGDALPDSLPSVVFTWPKESDGTDGEDRPAPIRRSVAPRTAARRDEARRLAGLVRSWIDEGRLVRDRDTNAVRPMQPLDVAFLFRALTDVAEYERALADAGLDFYVIGGSAFYAQQEVQDLINVLAALDDPYDSVALAGALRGPFFALSDEALFWLSTVRRNDLFAGLAHVHASESALPDLAAHDRKLALRAYGLLTRWRSFKDREPIARFVDRVLDESGFEASLMGESLGDRKRANARKLVRMARTYDEQGGFALADFVSRLRADLRDPPREEQAATTGELGDAVRLLTIHKAKGLEFPVVILPDLDRRSGPRHDRVALHPELGPLLRVTVEGDDDAEDDEDTAATGSLGWLVYRRLAEAEDREEALRIFYVATTRARDLLVLSTSGEPEARSQSPALNLLLERFDARTGTLRGLLPDGWAVPRIEVVRDAPPASRGVRRRRPPLLAVARLIESALPPPSEGFPHGDDARPSHRPSYLRLSSELYLPPRAARLDRLVRDLWLDKRVFRRGKLDEVAADVARRQSPEASGRLVEEAVARIRPYVEGSLGRQIAAAAEDRRGLAWSITWPEGGEGGTVIEGALDLAFRDKSGDWSLIHTCDSSSPLPVERLRLALSARLAPRLGLGPIARMWLLAHGPDGGLRGAEPADEAMIEDWLTIF
jgi:ATP-dependent helicase/nuclease subunit A